MKTLNIFFLLVTVNVTSSCGQSERQNRLLKLDLWKHIDTRDINVNSVQGSNRQSKMHLPYHDFYVDKINIGSGCMFAVSKIFPEEWIQEVPKRNCLGNRNAYQSILCLSRQIFSDDTVFLKNQMDLYFFLIEKKDMGPPVSEEAEGGTIVSYYPKKGSTVLVYKYEDNKWLELARIKQDGDENARNFGQKYMEKIALTKMN